MGSCFSRFSTTGKSTTAVLKALRKLGSAATDAQNKLASKRHRTKPQVLHQLESNFKEVDDFVYRGSDKFFVYNRWTGGYKVQNSVMLMKEAARLTAILEDAVRELVVVAGPSYILSDGSTWERATAPVGYLR